jgi:hypothetical protein
MSRAQTCMQRFPYLEAIQPARMRSHEDRLGDRWRERFTQELVLEQKGSATRERTPPGSSNWARMAIKRLSG